MGKKPQITQDNLSQIKASWPRIQQSTTTEAQYELALCAFEERPSPEGPLLQWVCHDDTRYLDLSTDRMDLKPA